MTTRGRILKSHEDITMTELTFCGGNAVMSKLSVRAASDPTSTKQFSDVDAANTYMKSLFRDDNAARQSNCRAEITSMAFSIFAMVSGASRSWYAVMQAEQQNCICQ